MKNMEKCLQKRKEFKRLFLGLFFTFTTLFSFSPAQGVRTIQPQILNVFPHLGKGFTQGFEIKNQRLYEGTGLVGQSKILITDLKTQKTIHSIELPQYFGEGITLNKNMLIQLTWKAKKAFVYQLPQLKIVDTLHYPREGWGLTHHKNTYIMSDGSDTLFFMDKKFNTFKKIPVRYNGQPLKHLNELEYAQGSIYANIWLKSIIAEINPKTGKVDRIIDCQNLLNIEKPSPHDVLNGIAFNPHTRTFFLTGKNWKNVFEVHIPRL